MNNYDRLLSSCKTISHCKILLPILTLLALTGCVKQTDFQEEDIRPLPHTIPAIIDRDRNVTYRDIDGIRQTLIDSPEQPVRILVIHGMITDKAGYSEGMQKRIGERLGLELTDNDPEAINITRGYYFDIHLGPQPLGPNNPKPSQLRKYIWTDPQKDNIERLIFYEVLWAPFRDQIKNNFFACFESRSLTPEERKDSCQPLEAKRNTDSRTWVNGFLKDNIMINGFADPMILLGSLGDVIKDDIMLANCIVAYDILDDTNKSLKKFGEERCSLSSYLTDEKTSQDAGLTLYDAPFFTITESLGSFLYQDTEQRFFSQFLRKDNKANLSQKELQDALLASMLDDSTVYMMANQISLLLLARYTVEYCEPDNSEEGGECPNHLLRGSTEFPEFIDPNTSKPQATYVAFNDVNDLLGFDITPNLQTGEFGRIVNISVRNPGLSIPFLFKSPNDAHRNHADNPAVIKAVVEGIEIPKKQLEN